jgi:hypothetical protein
VTHTPPRRGLPIVAKIAIALALVAGFAWLFVRSLQDARAEPYTTRAAHLTGWNLALEEGAAPGEAVLLLRAHVDFPTYLFRQVFARAAETLGTPRGPGVALALRHEVDASAVTGATLMSMAVDAGLDRAGIAPICMGYRRESAVGTTRQLFFVLLDLPEFARFRQALASHLRTAAPATVFDPAALPPVVLLAASPDFNRWLPLTVDPSADCLAPISVE